ncbi:peptide chain release factor N(5)-glutamine methyltransferase [Pseudoalteromonas rubra]|uniref:Release factor glutamine methyltransferase n=1 Tax=Pseudoalteromonas rubra TaxID=43658 RepID=A0A5S3WKI8_9GAMM|nr:peptide chain release factor N(5)-glutamine methyltransferase [Pseudoalteromonas rubra]TMP28034.1 peptide chain release factor N(5)-glutamine methyltransferase [Pseudoalteromonas rubra]TMP29220.1 peptide chain release factor N(5)-glutamine methyltransferase [Pseudoalteromonas rubra]
MAQHPNLAQAIAWASAQLQNSSESAKLDAEVLLLHVLQKTRSYLFAWPEAELSEAQYQRFESLIARRRSGEPVAHLTGEREFWSLPLYVNNSTLIPRPDTETLVEQALALPLSEQAKVLDLGTGTGAIVLALASEQPGWQLTGVDFSDEAVALAEKNRQRLGFDHVEIRQSDWFSALADQCFDLIVSNPPYICEADEHLSQGDVRFEPLSALVAPDQGYADIRHIIEQAQAHLASDGYLMFEHGYQQAAGVQQIFAQMNYRNILTIKDMAGCDRVTMAQKPQ